MVATFINKYMQICPISKPFDFKLIQNSEIVADEGPGARLYMIVSRIMEKILRVEELLKDLISIPSPSGKEQVLAEYLAGLLGNYGFETDRKSTRLNSSHT